MSELTVVVPAVDPILDWHSELARRGIAWTRFEWGKFVPDVVEWVHGSHQLTLWGAANRLGIGLDLDGGRIIAWVPGVFAAVEADTTKLRLRTAKEILDLMNTDMMMAWMSELEARGIAFTVFSWNESVNAPSMAWEDSRGRQWTITEESGMYSGIALHCGPRRVEVVHTKKGGDYRPIASVARDIFRNYRP